jgi:hypothetical protein
MTFTSPELHMLFNVTKILIFMCLQGDLQHRRNSGPEEASPARRPDPVDDDGLQGRVLHHLLVSQNIVFIDTF